MQTGKYVHCVDCNAFCLLTEIDPEGVCVTCRAWMEFVLADRTGPGVRFDRSHYPKREEPF